MTDYTELVKALRYCAETPEEEKDCNLCDYYPKCSDVIAKDAAAAIEELQALYRQMDKRNTDLHNEGYDVGYYAGRRDWEPKRGEWVKNKDRVGWHCSVCKVDNNYAYSWNSETGKNEFQDKYCPNCGAKMEVQDGQ